MQSSKGSEAALPIFADDMREAGELLRATGASCVKVRCRAGRWRDKEGEIKCELLFVFPLLLPLTCQLPLAALPPPALPPPARVVRALRGGLCGERVRTSCALVAQMLVWQCVDRGTMLPGPASLRFALLPSRRVLHSASVTQLSKRH